MQMQVVDRLAHAAGVFDPEGAFDHRFRGRRVGAIFLWAVAARKPARQDLSEQHDGNHADGIRHAVGHGDEVTSRSLGGGGEGGGAGHRSGEDTDHEGRVEIEPDAETGRGRGGNRDGRECDLDDDAPLPAEHMHNTGTGPQTDGVDEEHDAQLADLVKVGRIDQPPVPEGHGHE